MKRRFFSRGAGMCQKATETEYISLATKHKSKLWIVRNMHQGDLALQGWPEKSRALSSNSWNVKLVWRNIRKSECFFPLQRAAEKNVACKSKDCQVPSLDIVKVLQRRHCLTELKGCKHETEQLVEHWDSFLKALAQRVLSYSVGTGGYRTMQITSLAFACIMCPSCCNFLHLGPWAF